MQLRPATSKLVVYDLRKLSAAWLTTCERTGAYPLPSQGKTDRAAAVRVVSSEFENVLMVAPALKKEAREQKS